MKYRDFAPALKYGAKIMPEDLAGMIGLPYVGKVFYVDPSAGSDTANSGTSQDDAFATVTAAYAACTSGKHDVVIIAPTGGTGRTTEVAAITWAKRFTHLIGSCAPVSTSPRAGLDFSSAVVSPCFTVSENGCIFKNLTFATSADINSMVVVSGSRNYFENCHIQGSTNDTAGNDAAWRALTVDGGDENLFVGCTIGVDTFARSTTNASLELTGVCERNAFKDCFFPTYGDNAGPLFVKVANNDAAQRWLLFQDCIFTNPVVGGSTAMTIGVSLFSNLLNGVVILRNSYFYGVTNMCDNASNVMVANHVLATAADSAIMSVYANT